MPEQKSRQLLLRRKLRRRRRFARLKSNMTSSLTASPSKTLARKAHRKSVEGGKVMLPASALEWVAEGVEMRIRDWPARKRR